MEDSWLTKIVFLADLERCENNWSSKVKLLFDRLGLSQEFLDRCAVSLEEKLKKVNGKDLS